MPRTDSLLETELRLGEIPTREELAFTDKFSGSWLQEQRYVGDPLADAVIADLKGKFPIRDPDDLLAEACRLAEVEGGIYRKFLDACYYLPPWADFAAMNQGARMFATMGPLISLSILGGGVAGSAFHVKAEPVFTSTGRFVVPQAVSERLLETGSIMFLIPLPGEIQPGGRHHRVVMKVRILHAAIRHWIRENDPDYDEKSLGTPINQEDMAYALLIFTYLNVRGLLRLGVRVTDDQIESLHLLWRYIGHVIGVDEAWLARDIAEQKRFYNAFLLHNATPDVASAAAVNLLEGALLHVPSPVRPLARRTVHQLTAYLGGEEHLGGLQLETAGSQLGMSLIKLYAGAYNRALRVPGVEPLLYRWGVRSLRRRYSSFGDPQREHGYGVTTVSRDDIDQAMTAVAPKQRA
jgi:hypothetical protein